MGMVLAVIGDFNPHQFVRDPDLEYPSMGGVSDNVGDEFAGGQRHRRQTGITDTRE